MCLNVALDDLQSLGSGDSGLVDLTPTSTAEPPELWGFGSYPNLYSHPQFLLENSNIESSVCGPLFLAGGRGGNEESKTVKNFRPETPPSDEVYSATSAGPSVGLFRRRLPNLSRVEKSAYKVLLKLREEIGWDHLVDVRMTVYGTTSSETPHEEQLDESLDESDPLNTSLGNISEPGDCTFERIGSTICSIRLENLFQLIRDDLESMFLLKREIKDGIVETKLSPSSLLRRINACIRFKKFDYLEIISSVFLCTRSCFDPLVLLALIRGYIRRDRQSDAFTAIVHLWLNLETKIFPVGKKFTLPPWLSPSVRHHGYRPYDHCPIWLHELVVDVAKKFGIDNLRRHIQNDNRLIVFDQMLAHIQISIL